MILICSNGTRINTDQIAVIETADNTGMKVYMSNGLVYTLYSNSDTLRGRLLHQLNKAMCTVDTDGITPCIMGKEVID